jgi:hypothetical protein
MKTKPFHMEQKSRLGNPVFLLMMAVLILNDWVLKATFYHPLVGKLSDFTGLFVLPFFLSALCPKWRTPIHVFTALIFIVWKSAWSQPLIDLMTMTQLPFDRTVDLTDCFALISIPLSYYVFEKATPVYRIQPWLIKGITVVSCIAITATSIPPHSVRSYRNINRTYEFAYSKHELVSRLNKMQIHEVRKVMRLWPVDFDSEKNIFFTRTSKDTLAILIDATTIQPEDTIRYKVPNADIQISGDGNKSTLKLISLYRRAPMFSEKDYRKSTIKRFENRIIRSLMKD